MVRKKFYFDTAIWVDYYEERRDKSKFLGEIAYSLLKKVIKSKGTIIVSGLILRELETLYSLDEINGLFFPFEGCLRIVEIKQSQVEESAKLALERNIPKGDALHAILARDNDAVLVTRDKHFELLSDVCIVKKPEDLL